MKFLILALLLFSSAAFASLTYPKLPDHDFGIGAQIGTTTGFTAKLNRDQRIAYDATLGWGSADNFRFNADVIWQKPHIFMVDHESFDGYLSAGGRIRDRGNNHDKNVDRGTQIGARGMGGVRYLFNDPHLEVFGEAGLVFDFIPAADADFEIALGARYFF